jgi:Tol biopolymer transport system component
MTLTDENTAANPDTSLRRRMMIALTLIFTVIICLTIVVGMEPAPTVGVAGGGTGSAPSGLLFLRNPAQAAELWLADSGGAQARMLVPAVSDYSSSPDGRRIIYATQAADEPSRIEIFDRTTGQTQILVQSPDFVSFSPLWSPASGPGVIVYERRTVTADGVGAPKLWLVKEDGTDLGAVMRGGDVVAYGARWSPDGTKLAFVDPLRSEIVLFNFSDQLRRVPLNGEFDWSPDGARLVVSAFPDGQEGDTRLFVYDLASESQQQIFGEAGSSDYMPQWSPDGRRIAFVRRTRSAPQGTIWVGTLADGVAAPVDPAARQAAAAFDDTDPQWSPDGKQLTWTRLALGAQRAPAAVWRATIDGSAPPARFVEDAMQARWIK